MTLCEISTIVLYRYVPYKINNLCKTFIIRLVLKYTTHFSANESVNGSGTVSLPFYVLVNIFKIVVLYANMLPTHMDRINGRKIKRVNYPASTYILFYSRFNNML